MAKRKPLKSKKAEPEAAARPTTLSRELVRSTFATDKLHIDLELDVDGRLNMSSWEIGSGVEKILECVDYERGVRLVPAAIQEACLRLRGEIPNNSALWLADVLTTIYTGDIKAIDHFVEFCDRMSIPYERWHWSGS